MSEEKKQLAIDNFQEARSIVQPFSMSVLKNYGPLVTAMAFMAVGVSLLVVSGQDSEEIAGVARRIALGLEDV